MQRYNQRLIEELKNKQTQERARLPKIQRSEAKTRMAMFKKSLRINSLASPDQDREKIKQVINKNNLNGVNVWCDINTNMIMEQNVLCKFAVGTKLGWRMDVCCRSEGPGKLEKGADVILMKVNKSTFKGPAPQGHQKYLNTLESFNSVILYAICIRPVMYSCSIQVNCCL